MMRLPRTLLIVGVLSSFGPAFGRTLPAEAPAGSPPAGPAPTGPAPTGPAQIASPLASPSASAPKPADPKAAVPVEPRTLPLAQGAVGMILGRQVVDQQGTHVGRLVDFVVSQSGAPLAGVIDVGGFMGIGAVRVAVAWRLLRFRHDLGDVQVVVAMHRDEIAAGPEFRGLDGGAVLVGGSVE